MATYAGLDVSDKTTHICVVDDAGGVVWRGVCATDPEVLARTLAKRCPGAARVVLETGALSAFLYHGLVERGVAVTCICARHAKGVLSVRSNKSDAHDAEGLAQLARTGWFKAVHIKDDATHLDRAQLKVREQMVKAHRAMLNQLRGLLKLFGLRLGQATTPARRQLRLKALLEQEPRLAPALAPLVRALAALETEVGAATRTLHARAARDPVCARLMSAPGVGPVVALTFKSAVEDPGRFARGQDVGAYAGLVPRRFQSGERDTRGRISKAGDPMLRHASTRPPTSCSGGSSGTAASRAGGWRWRPPRAPSAPVSPSPASWPPSCTPFGAPRKTSSGPEPPSRLTGAPKRTISLMCRGPTTPGTTETSTPHA